MLKSERFNVYSHLVGSILAVAGVAVALVHAGLYRDVWKIVSSSIYGAGVVLVFVVSTLYHLIAPGRKKHIFQCLDHCVIYVMIAASYTPYALVPLRGAWGWSIFGVSWGLAVVGIVQEILIGRKTQFFSMIIYVLMGWLMLVAIKPILASLSLMGLMWLFLGGIIYTLGIIFFLLDEKYTYAHGIWHLFVVAGAVCHYIGILMYV